MSRSFRSSSIFWLSHIARYAPSPARPNLTEICDPCVNIFCGMGSNAIGIRSKAGRYGGTYAHRDIAYHFGMWIAPKFQLLLVKEYQRLKSEEQKQLGWSAKRELSKINYRIHTDAIKHNLIPAEITKTQASIIYANEADVLNVAMFGMTAKQWRDANPDTKGNIRDYASINELICLSNMENLNAVFIEQGISQSERLVKLNQIAIHQMSILECGENNRKLLKCICLRGGALT